MLLRGVVVSSVEHLASFDEIVRGAGPQPPAWTLDLDRVVSWKGRAERRQYRPASFPVPSGFPHVRMFWLLPVPVVFFARVRLQLAKGTLSLRPVPFSIVPLGAYRNLRTDVACTLEAADVLAIESFDHARPGWEYFGLPFVRIRTRRPAPLSDLLLCAGLSWWRSDYAAIHKQTAALRAELRRAFPEASEEPPIGPSS